MERPARDLARERRSSVRTNLIIYSRVSADVLAAICAPSRA